MRVKFLGSGTGAAEFRGCASPGQRLGAAPVRRNGRERPEPPRSGTQPPAGARARRAPEHVGRGHVRVELALVEEVRVVDVLVDECHARNSERHAG